ncbi:MAG: hypothetical protein ACYC6Y_08750 [Thermoguttaceae bacterium]
MSTGGPHPAVAKAAAAFNEREGRTDGAVIAERLTRNLTCLRESLLRRILAPEKQLPLDSMFLPVSQLRAQQHASEELEAFMIAESACAARTLNLLKGDQAWYVSWLSAMRLDSWNPLGNVPQRIAAYLAESGDQRRLQFSNLLVEVIPQARLAPLVLFRILPTTVHVATALAFGNANGAERFRAEQIKILPSITYCQQCHGAILEEGKECAGCGNPLWNRQWLCEID